MINYDAPRETDTPFVVFEKLEKIYVECYYLLIQMEAKMEELKRQEQMDPVPVPEAIEPEVPTRKVVMTDAILIGAIKEAVRDLAVYLTIAKARKMEVSFQFAATKENPETISAHGFVVKKDITDGTA